MYKARLVVKGFQQREDRLYGDFLSYCEVNYDQICSEHCGSRYLHLKQVDVKTVFLHGNLEDICMMQPHGYIISGKDQLMSLYGLKQALSEVRQIYGQQWIHKAAANHCCYSKWFENFYIILLLYVNDMLVAGSSMKEIVTLKAKMVEESQ